MRRLLIGTLALTMTFPPLPAQKIDTETPSRERVVRVQTAMNHLTVIEVAEPVATVAVGSPQAFKVERRENKVFIQPLQENVATNLFIWTASTRLNYELVPAVSDAGQMDFAIDYRQPQPQAQVAQPKPAPVAVVSLTGLKFDRSRWAFQNAQLGMEYASRLKTYDAPIPVKITQCEPGVAEVGPGEARIGLIALQLPQVKPDARRTQPTVLKILFPIDRAGNLTATLVL